jgi:hypothetical protein
VVDKGSDSQSLKCKLLYESNDFNESSYDIQKFIDDYYERKPGYYLTFKNIWDDYKSDKSHYKIKSRSAFQNKIKDKMGKSIDRPCLSDKMGKSIDRPCLSDKYFQNTNTKKLNNKGRINSNCVYVDWHYNNNKLKTTDRGKKN